MGRGVLTCGGKPMMPANPPSDALGTHPGELACRVMTTHPPSVNPDSEAGERRL